MSDRIAASLRRLFEEHRIVFWYDADRDMRAEFDAVDLPGVTKLEIANNEFGLKYRMLRQEPKARFLLFKDGPEPADGRELAAGPAAGHGRVQGRSGGDLAGRAGPAAAVRERGARAYRVLPRQGPRRGAEAADAGVATPRPRCACGCWPSARAPRAGWTR